LQKTLVCAGEVVAVAHHQVGYFLDVAAEELI